MNKTIKKIVASPVASNDVTSLWLDTTLNILKYFKNGIWTRIENVVGSALLSFEAYVLTATSITTTMLAFKDDGTNNKSCGTFIATGATPVTVNSAVLLTGSVILISLNTVGGTVGALPVVQTITAEDNFTVVATAGDTSTYNYIIIDTF